MGMEVDRLEIAIQAEATKANAELEKLIGKLGKVSSALTATNSNGLRNFANGISQLSKSMQSMSGVKTTDFNRLVNGLNKLGGINTSGLYKSSNALRNFTNTMNGMGSVSDDAVKLATVANGISKLGGASVQKAIVILPQLSVALKNFMTVLSTSPNVSQNIINMTNAMANLASQGSKYGSTIKSMASATKTLTKSNSTATSSFKSSKSALTSLTAQVWKLYAAYFAVRRVIGFVGDSVKKSMDFTETVNLFQTSFKKIGMEQAESMGMEWGSSSANAFAKGYIDRAQNFNDLLTSSLGLDPNTMMNYQAVFAQMSNSMGLVTDSAMNISESFTMLGNDIASLWNIDTKSAMQKLQSGLAGQIRPLRQLGIDISQTSLQMTAHNHGIDDSVIKMSQAAKVQLRWLSVMEQAEVAFGDMAKTIDSPANQLRILKQQWDLLSRSIGNVFLHAIQTILPYVNAVVIALRNMINTLATAMGYEIPDYTDSNIYTDATTDIDGMTDGIEDATTANEKLKKSMYSGDELNILSSGKGSGSGGVDSGSGYDVLDDAIQQKTDSYMKKFNEELDKMSIKAELLADGMAEFFKPLSEFFKNIDWKTINKDLGILWGYLEPYTKSIGEVGVAFLETLGKGINTLVTAVDAFMTSDQGKAVMDFLSDFTALNLEDTTIWLEKVGVAFDALTKFIDNPNAKNAGSLIGSVLDAGKSNPLLPTTIIDNLAIALTGKDYSTVAKAVWAGIGDALKDAAIIQTKNVIDFVVAFPQTASNLKTLWDKLTKDLVGKSIDWTVNFPQTAEKLFEKWALLTMKLIGKEVDFLVSIPQKWVDLQDDFYLLASKFIGKNVKFLVSIPQIWADLSPLFSVLFNSFIGKKVDFKVAIPQVWEDLKSRYDALRNAFIGKVVNFSVNLVTSLGDIRKFVKTLIDAINTEIIAKLQIKIGGFTVSAPKIPYPTGYKDGGYPTPGQLFVANEPGNPELVGNVGGRTSVMNNNQIVEAVSQGVAVAVASVIGGGNRSQSSGGDVVIMVDSEEFARIVNKGNAKLNGRFSPVMIGG